MSEPDDKQPPDGDDSRIIDVTEEEEAQGIGYGITLGFRRLEPDPPAQDQSNKPSDPS